MGFRRDILARMRMTAPLCIALTMACTAPTGGERPRPLLQEPRSEVGWSPGAWVFPDGSTSTSTTTTDTADPTSSTTVLGTTVTQLPPPGTPACVGTIGGTWFQDVRDCAGLSGAINVQQATLDWLKEAVTPQVFADFDGDTWLDVLVGGPGGLAKLYLGSPTGVFVERADPDLVALQALGAVATDFDNDGDMDVMIAGPGTDAYLENTGTELVVGTGPSDLHMTLSVSVADVDGDGDHEVYTANYSCPDCAWTTFCEYTNDGLWVDDPVTGWTEIANTSFTPMNAHCGFAFIGLFSDFDGDQDPDLYLVNDRGSDQPDAPDGPTLRNAYFRNDGPGCGAACFTEVAIANGSVAFVDGMGADSGDYDNDGDLDILVSNAGPPMVFQNDGTGNFTNVSASIGLLTPVGLSGWGVLWLDFDNDGDLDIHLATTYQDRFYENDNGFYWERTDVALPTETIESRGTAYADYDRDGRLDLMVGDPGGLFHLYRNTVDNGNNWLGLRLVGSTGPGSRDALGAVVTVEDSSGRVQMREVLAGRAQGGGSDLGVHFGLGGESLVQATVRWPDGVEEIVPVVENAWSVVTR